MEQLLTHYPRDIFNGKIPFRNAVSLPQPKRQFLRQCVRRFPQSLLHQPAQRFLDYKDRSQIMKINELIPNETATFLGQVRGSSVCFSRNNAACNKKSSSNTSRRRAS